MASTAVDIAFTSMFDAEVKQAYQRQGSFLLGTVRKRNISSAKDLTFQKTGTSSATTKSRHGLIASYDVSHTTATATLGDYYASSLADSLDLIKTNIDERMVLANANAWSLGRKADDLVITSLATATNSTTMTLTSSKTFRNQALTAVKALKRRDAGLGNVWAVVSPTYWAWLMCVAEFTSRDFVEMNLPYQGANGQKVTGKNWLGVNWIEHTGVTNEGLSTEVNYLYDQAAIGLAVGMDVSSQVDYLAERDSYQIMSKMSLGAVLIDDNGVQKMALDATAALPTT